MKKRPAREPTTTHKCNECTHCKPCTDSFISIKREPILAKCVHQKHLIFLNKIACEKLNLLTTPSETKQSL